MINIGKTPTLDIGDGFRFGLGYMAAALILLGTVVVIGAALGVGAHLTFLRRIDTGGLGVERCVTLAQLEAMDEAQRLACVLPPESLLVGHTRVTLDGDNAARFLSGVRRRGPWPDASAVAVFGDQPAALLGVGHIVGGELVPGRLLSPLEIQQILEGTPHSASMAHSGTLEKL